MVKVRQKIYCPHLFMAANWFSEKQMRKLFVAGLKKGVRGFDTAREYNVEHKVGRALKEALLEVGLKRNDVFIQTRISNEELIRGNVRDELKRSLDYMGIEYLDCFMFHWPTPNFYISAWKELETIYQNDDFIKSIGICNCRLRHLLDMEKSGVQILPHILQVEVTPFWQVKDLKAYCDEHNITLQAFSPLCKMIKPIRENEILKELSDKYKVTLPQIILRWHVQRGIIPISLSSNVDRVKTNFDILNFKISDFDMEKISAIDCGYKYHLESATCFGF